MQYGDKMKDTNSDVTFVIATTETAKEQHGEKLIVSLQDPVPKIKKCSPTSPESKPAATSPNGKTKVAQETKLENTSGKKHKRYYDLNFS